MSSRPTVFHDHRGPSVEHRRECQRSARADNGPVRLSGTSRRDQQRRHDEREHRKGPGACPDAQREALMIAARQAPVRTQSSRQATATIQQQTVVDCAK